jgi:acyl-CoA synthetase (NDP forming)
VNLDLLHDASFPLNDGSGGRAVTEPAVKRWLRALNGAAIPTPEAVLLPPNDAGLSLAHGAWAGLREPLVLKAFGPGIVHKSELGAVRIGLRGDQVADAISQMGHELAVHRHARRGFFIEEQYPPGVELIVGVIRHPSVGPVLMLGMGGTFAEILDSSVVRLCPISPDAAEQMLDTLPGAALLRGVRGKPPIDRQALIELLLAIAGSGTPECPSVVEALGDELLEFECNPVVATPSGVCALDARLVLAPPMTPDPVPPAPPTDFTPLFAPKSIAIAGASGTKVTFGNRFLAAYRAAGWTENLYAIHPTAAEIDGVPAVSSVTKIAGGVDYLLVAIPAARCADLVREAAGHARFVHIVSGGFGETGSDGVALQDGLRAAAREVGVRVLGPNCMGVYSPRGRQTFQLGPAAEPGGISVLSQSGGLAGDILQAGRRAGLKFAQLASIGNAVDVTAAELLDWMVDDPNTEIIGLYLEGLADGRRLADALRRADGVKPVVLLVGGGSAQGARAVASHTGSMTSDARIWQAIVESTGATRVATLEDLIGTLTHLQRWAKAKSFGAPEVLVVGPGGGASVLSADACDRAGLQLARVSDQTQQELRALGYGAGTSVANPLEIPLGPATGADTFARILEPLLAREWFADVLLHINVAAYYGYGPPDLAPLAELIKDTGEIKTGGTGGIGRVALVLRNFEVARGVDADLVAQACREADLPTFATLDAAARAIAAVQKFSATRTSSRR